MEPRALSEYVHVLRPLLPLDAFRQRPLRLAWLALHALIVTGSIVAIAHGWGGLWGAAALSLVIGHSFAGGAFVAHELLHGAVMRDSRLRHVIGWFAFLPFVLSPRLWTVWHNKIHHGHTMQLGVDPDLYPSLVEYRASRVLRIVEQFSLGRGHLFGVASLFLGFTGQGLQVLVSLIGDRRYFSRREQLLTLGETLAGVVVWLALGLALGPLRMLFAFGLPLLVANAVVMGYIVTNHGLSPYTEVNDPLLNSLTVTTPRLMQLLHLNFGFHVEHHLFPSMSSAHAPAVAQLVREHWPERYQSMPLTQALWQLVRTPRIHLTATTLVDPQSGRQWSTLMPKALPRLAAVHR